MDTSACMSTTRLEECTLAKDNLFFVAYLARGPVSTCGRASPGLLLPLDLPTAGKQTRRE